MPSIGITGIDHVILGVASLDDACASLAKLGFTFSPRGVHETYGSHNTTIVLEDRYIEVFSFFDTQKFPQHFMLPIMRKMGDGVIGIGYGTTDADATHAGLEATFGPIPYPVTRLQREMTLANGEVMDVRVAVGLIPPSMPHPYFSFTCQHFTPEFVWRQEWQKHPNQIRGFEGFTVAVDGDEQLTRAIDQLRAINAGNLTITAASATLTTQRGWIRIETLDAIRKRLPASALDRPVPLPFIASLTLSSADLAETAAFMRIADSRVVIESTRIIVPAALAHGCVLEVVPQARE